MQKASARRISLAERRHVQRLREATHRNESAPVQRQRKFSAVSGTLSAKSCKATRRERGRTFWKTRPAVKLPAAHARGASWRHIRHQQHTSMTIRPAGWLSMVQSKKTVGFGILAVEVRWTRNGLGDDTTTLVQRYQRSSSHAQLVLCCSGPMLCPAGRATNAVVGRGISSVSNARAPKLGWLCYVRAHTAPRPLCKLKVAISRNVKSQKSLRAL